MDRRLFLKYSAAVLAGIAGLLKSSPVKARLPDKSEREYDVAVIGVGTAGCNIIKVLFQKGFPLMNLIAADQEHDLHSVLPAIRKVLVSIPSTCCEERELDAMKRILQADLIYREQAAAVMIKICDLIPKGIGKVVIVSGLGGVTASIYSPLIAERMKDAGYSVHCIVTTPFAFEGPFRKRIAGEAVDLLKHNCDHVDAVWHEEMFFRMPSTVKVKEAFAFSDQEIAHKVLQYCRSL